MTIARRSLHDDDEPERTHDAAGSILSLDVGKYKSVACLYGSAEDTRFTTITTSRTELTRLFAKYRPRVVLIEACLLCGWVRGLCVELGIVCLVANTQERGVEV